MNLTLKDFLTRLEETNDIEGLVKQIEADHPREALLKEFYYLNFIGGRYTKAIKAVIKKHLNTYFSKYIAREELPCNLGVAKVIVKKEGVEFESNSLRFNVPYSSEQECNQIYRNLVEIKRLINEGLNDMKPLPSKQDVINVMTTLFNNEKEITNLHIKEELRRQDFWATQIRVGQLTDDICKNADIDNLQFSFNGTYRNYSIGAPLQIADPVVSTPGQPTFSCWKRGDPASEVSITADTRGQAKWNYTKEYGGTFFQIRTKKLN